MTGVEPWYNAGGVAASCPSECRPCAQCLRRHEFEAKHLARPAGCDCTGLSIGVDPCYLRGSCECFCQNYQRIVSACPELADDF